MRTSANTKTWQGIWASRNGAVLDVQTLSASAGLCRSCARRFMRQTSFYPRMIKSKCSCQAYILPTAPHARPPISGSIFPAEYNYASFTSNVTAYNNLSLLRLDAGLVNIFLIASGRLESSGGEELSRRLSGNRKQGAWVCRSRDAGCACGLRVYGQGCRRPWKSIILSYEKHRRV